MAKKESKIVFNVTSYEGDTEFSMLPKAAMAKIKQLAKEQNKWLYVNGEITNTEILKESDLVKAQESGFEIMLMNGLAGGCDMLPEKNIEINFSVEKDMEGIEIRFDEDDHHKCVDIFVGKDDMIDLIHSRNAIVKALERKLDEFAEREVAGLRMALNV